MSSINKENKFNKNWFLNPATNPKGFPEGKIVSFNKMFHKN